VSIASLDSVLLSLEHPQLSIAKNTTCCGRLRKTGSGYVYGFRIPLIIISPYAKPAYVSHVTHDFGSVLHFVEITFHLPSLGYADADDFSECFNLTQRPLSFQTISAQLKAAYFINDKRPPTDPDDD
jgi:phospholipase C